jgi:hypothetical protein
MKCICREFHRAGTLLNTKVCNPDEGSVSYRDAARRQFMTFVMDTYKGLYSIESRVMGGKPSIGLFCRLDIGLISAGGKMYYFVNEVERNQTTSLWSNRDGGKSSTHVTIGVLGETFAEAFHNWLSDISSSSS